MTERHVVARAQVAEGYGWAKSPTVAEGPGVQVANPGPPSGQSTRACAQPAEGVGAAGRR